VLGPLLSILFSDNIQLTTSFITADQPDKSHRYYRHYQKKKVVGLELGPLSLVTTIEELLDRKVAASV
jgi:hypothetical protein